MKEEWKWIPGFENQYQASTLGQIKSFKKSSKGLIMTGTKSKDGRVRVNLGGKKYLVHRLVLLTFKPEERNDSDDIVMHLDGNPTNNCLDNLKWGTYKENASDEIAIRRNKEAYNSSKQRRKDEQTKHISDEVWKDIEGYEGVYQISNYGRVKSFKRGKPYIMSAILQPTGDYYTIGLCTNGKKKQYSIDRLVAKAFVKNSNPKEYVEVNHIDENPSNNYYKNLEWCSHKQNVQHSIYRQSIPVEQYDLDGNFLAEYSSIAEASRQVGVTRCGIYNIFKGKQKTAGGYKWKKKQEEVNGTEKN